MSIIQETVDVISGTGAFTPPQPECSSDCRYEGLEIVHDDNCEENK